MIDAQFQKHDTRVIGLRLPNGTEIWPPGTWHGRAIDTPEDRQVIVDALRESTNNLGMETSQLVSQFHWLVRIDTTYTTTVVGESDAWPLNSPQSAAFLMSAHTTPIEETSVLDGEGYEEV